MSQLYYPVGGNNFINTTDYIDYSNNLQNIYVNIENNIRGSKNLEPLIELKDTLYKELTSDCNELFQEVVKEINSEKEKKLKENDSDKKSTDPVESFRNAINEFKKIFLKKQDEFIDIDIRLKTETKKVKKDLETLEKMITFINNLDDDYSETEEIKKINENIILLSQKIEKNNDIKSAKEEYIKIRIDINECFDIIKTLNNLNYSNTCSLCLTNKVQEFINPCGHCLCSECKTRYIQHEDHINNINCPICRGYIKDFQPLYL